MSDAERIKGHDPDRTPDNSDGIPITTSPDSASAVTNASDESDHHHEMFKQFMASTPIKLSDIRNFARLAPLVSSILAPLSTLLDIPALTQHWFYDNGNGVHDPKACVALSAIGLAFNVVGNVLLVLRFSSPHRSSRAVSFSLYCWIAKTIIALVNISYFGAYRNNHPEYTYDEGFWCGVVSVIIAGIISICLLLHYTLAYKHDHADSKKLQLTGRKFMMSITVLFVLVGFQALAFSRLEHWKYFDGIYFSIQMTLTVGYGDLVPTTTWSKILCFPFAILTIAQLANQISIIIDFIKDRAAERRSMWRKRYSIAMHRAALQKKPYATLIDEISLIHQIELHQQSLLQGYDLIWSFIGLITFYVVGAAIFHAIEGWGYGNAVYAVVILSTSVGLGDFSPETPGGRVFWICYAMMCVPIITSFATNTVTGILYTISEHKYQQSGFRIARDEDPEAFAPHSHLILKNHEKWDSARTAYQDHVESRKKEFTSRVELSKKQRLMSNLLDDPTTRDAVVTALGGEDIRDEEKDKQKMEAKEEDGHDSQELSSEATRVGESPRPKHAKSDDGDTSSDGDHDAGGPSRISTPATPQLMIQTLTHSNDGNRDQHTVHDHLASDCEKSHKTERSENTRIEFKLCKALIDRVTHLEAQSRQMLVDTMDENLARTVLLADRNLQVRDALHLYDFGIDMQGNYRAEAEKAWKEAVAKHGLGDASSGEQDDMLARVRRYRDTFAEILVLSSTLLQLQGDDLKRFERWRTGDLHHEIKVHKVAHDVAGKVREGVREGKPRPSARSREKRRPSMQKKAAELDPDADAQRMISESEPDIEDDLHAHTPRDMDDCPPESRTGLHSPRRSGSSAEPSRDDDDRHPRSRRLPEHEHRRGSAHSEHSLVEAHTGSQVHRHHLNQRLKLHHNGTAGPPTEDVENDGRGHSLRSPRHQHRAHKHHDRCGSEEPTPSPSPSRSPALSLGSALTANSLNRQRSPMSAHPACSPNSYAPTKQKPNRQQRFIDIMSRSVLKAADREANQEREGWMEWLADKAYDIISDAGHAVQVRHSGRGSTTQNENWGSWGSSVALAHGRNDGGESGTQRRSEGEGEGEGEGTHAHAHAHARESSDGESDGYVEHGGHATAGGRVNEHGTKMRGGGERERAGGQGGHGDWNGGAGQGGAEEGARARAADKDIRRAEQEARRRERRHQGSKGSDGEQVEEEEEDEEDEGGERECERARDTDGRERMTMLEHARDIKDEIVERRAAKKERKEREDQFDIPAAPDPWSVPLPNDRLEPVSMPDN